MEKSNISFIKIGGIIGTIYYNSKFKKSLVYAKGAPGPWDNGSSDYQELSTKYKINIIVPDYKGFARSDGDTFNMKGCVDTIVECFDLFKGKTSGLLLPSLEEIKFLSSEVLVVGNSFGGSVVPFIDKFYPDRKDIKYISFLAPLLDWRSQSANNSIKEEGMDEFDILSSQVLKNIYRNYSMSEFHFMAIKDENTLKKNNPLDNLDFLADKIVYIAHGNRDKSIYWKKSLNFYQQLKKINKNTDFKMLKNIKHGGKIKAIGLGWLIEKFLKL